MESVTGPTIVVGVSGSHASAEALRWAADEAMRRDAHLHVVMCWTPEAHAYYAPRHGEARDSGQEHLRQLEATVRTVLNSDARDLTTEVIQGVAERTLVAESAGADLLVLGSASSGQAGLVGPVIRTCLGRACCPVVVVGPPGSNERRQRSQHERRRATPAAGLTAAARP